MQLVERIGRRIKLRDLNIFLTVANERSISKAAIHLAISQPAVSKAIADMEHTLGAPLLDRGPRGVEPTPYGRVLINRSVVIFDELRQSVTDIASLRDPSTGEARIGSTGPLAAGLVPAIIETMTRRFPRVSIQGIESNVFDPLLRELRDRNIDLVIGRPPAPITDEELESEVLFHDRLLVVAGSRSKWANRRKIQLDELFDEPWAIPPHVTAAFRTARLPTPRPTVPFAAISTHIHLVASGRFLGVFPESMLRFSAEKLPLKALPIDLPIQQLSVVIVTRKNRTLSAGAKLFIETARALTRTLASGK